MNSFEIQHSEVSDTGRKITPNKHGVGVLGATYLMVRSQL